MCLANFCSQLVTLYETNIAPNTGWLEDDCFCLWDGFNREGTDAFAVSFREGVSSVFFVSILDGLGPCWFEQALLPRPKEQWMYYRIAMSAPKVVFIVCIKKYLYIYIRTDIPIRIYDCVYTYIYVYIPYICIFV